MACSWRGIYQRLKYINVWNVTILNMLVQGHQSFVTVLDLSSKFLEELK